MCMLIWNVLQSMHTTLQPSDKRLITRNECTQAFCHNLVVAPRLRLRDLNHSVWHDYEDDGILPPAQDPLSVSGQPALAYPSSRFCGGASLKHHLHFRLSSTLDTTLVPW